MACRNTQLYDCSQPESSNIEVFYVPEGSTVLVESTGLADGQTIPILKRNDATGVYEPYMADGAQVTLDEVNSAYLFEEEGFYQLDTSGVDCTDGRVVTVEANTVPQEQLVDPMVLALSLCSSPEALTVLRDCLGVPQPAPEPVVDPAASTLVGPATITVADGGGDYTSTVVDTDGNPMEGANVQYTIASNETGAVLVAPSCVTDASGICSQTVSSVTAAGEYTVTATVDGQEIGSVTTTVTE